jgi:transcriptional regulator with XRE-family HTH domain
MTSACWHGDQLCAKRGTSKQRLGTSRDVFCYRRGCSRAREAGELNEPLRRALLRARLREDDVAAYLGVDPKTVRRWLNGRIPYASNRAALADLVDANEADLWPEASGPLIMRTRPEDLDAVYPHRRAIPHQVWACFFDSAEREIGILAYSALFLAQDADILRILADKARADVRVRIALGDPDSPHLAERGEEGTADVIPTEIRDALDLYRSVGAIENVEIRLHQATLYNSIYRADDRILVNQRVHGVRATDAPIFALTNTAESQIARAYLEAFERIWAESVEQSF